MTYVSRPVRHVSEHPEPGETITLLLRFDDEVTSEDRLMRMVKALNGSVEAVLEFETIAVTVAQPDVSQVIRFEGLEAVETPDVLEIDPDGAGEDVEYKRS